MVRNESSGVKDILKEVSRLLDGSRNSYVGTPLTKEAIDRTAKVIAEQVSPYVGMPAPQVTVTRDPEDPTKFIVSFDTTESEDQPK